MQRGPKFQLKYGQSYGFPTPFRIESERGEHRKIENGPWFHKNLMKQVGGDR